MGLCWFIIFKKEKNGKTWEEWCATKPLKLLKLGTHAYWAFLRFLIPASLPFHFIFSPCRMIFLQMRRHMTFDSCEVLDLTDIIPRERLPSGSLWAPVHSRKILISPA